MSLGGAGGGGLGGLECIALQKYGSVQNQCNKKYVGNIV